MAIAFDASSDAGEFTAATDPKTWTHTPTGTPRGVLVFAQNPGTTADWINGTVSYGGVAMTRVPTNGWAVDSAVEVASIYAYFLGTGIPTGAQTVSIDHNNGVFGNKWACCITLTGAADTEVVASGKITADTANPSIALDSGTRTAVKLFNLYSGKDAIASITNDSGITRVVAAKYASENRSRVVGYRTTPGTGSETVSQTATSDDVAMIGVAIAEVATTTGTGAITLVPAAVSGTGSQVFTATGSITLQPVSVSGTGAESLAGTGSLTLAPAAVSGTGAETFTATGSLTLAPASVTGSGLAGAVGTGALTLPPAAVSGSGVHVENATGTGALTLQPVAVSGTGTESLAGTGSLVLAPVSVSGAGTEAFTATGALTLQPAAVSGTGAETFTATGALTIAPVAVSGTGAESLTGTGAVTLPALAVSGAGAETFTATGSLVLTPVEVSGTGAESLSGSGSLTLAPVSVAGAGQHGAGSLSGSGALTLPPVSITGSGVQVLVRTPVGYLGCVARVGVLTGTAESGALGGVDAAGSITHAPPNTATGGPARKPGDITGN